MLLQEPEIPVHDTVRGACEILGLDPLYVANEGKLIAIVPGRCRSSDCGAHEPKSAGKGSAFIGDVVSDHPGMVAHALRLVACACLIAFRRTVSANLLRHSR